MEEKNNTIIQLKSVGRSYGKKSNKFDALKNINLTITKGESVAIIGKSGSGKSTLMHILALLDKPTTGEIFIKDTPVNKLSTSSLNKIRNKSFGFVFQSFFMNANDSVLSNAMVPLVIAGVPYRKRKEKAIAALKSVGLIDKITVSNTYDIFCQSFIESDFFAECHMPKEISYWALSMAVLVLQERGIAVSSLDKSV